MISLIFKNISCIIDIESIVVLIHFQEQQKEAEELKLQVQDYKKEEECTIRTNSQPEPPVTDPLTNR